MKNNVAPPLPPFVVITGREGSGKDSYAHHLAEKGYLHIAAGDVIRDRAREQGYSDPIPRSILSKIGDQMKRELGDSPITESAWRAYEQQDHPVGLVISGLRRVGEIEACKARGGVVLWIDANDRRRFQNLQKRENAPSWEAFVTVGESEYNGTTTGGKTGVNLHDIQLMADCHVANSGTLEDLFRNADLTLARAV